MTRILHNISSRQLGIRSRVVVVDEHRYLEAKEVLARTSEQIVADVPDYLVLSVQDISLKALHRLRRRGIKVVDDPEYALER